MKFNASAENDTNLGAPLQLNTFNKSKHGLVDSTQYSLLECLYDKQLLACGFQERFEILNSYLDDLKAQKLYTYRREMAGACLPMVEMEKKQSMIHLASNDYLNMSQHPRVKSAAALALETYGMGSGSVPMLTGTHALHTRLEKKLAEFKGVEDAMIFSSGYGTNMGVLRALLGPHDVAICDAYAHASLMDGCAHASRMVFRHNDLNSLEHCLNKAKDQQNKLVVLDGVYSMDGDIARLDEITEMAHHYGAWVLMDDAHGTGVIGQNGRGTLDYFAHRAKADVLTGTFSKALGSVGGFVGGSKEMISYLQIATRSYMFSTSPALPVTAGVIAALEVLESNPDCIQKLWRNIDYFTDALRNMGLNIGNTQTAIIPIILGDDTKVKQMAYQLHEAGILVNAVPYPAVPKKLTRVRVSLTAGLELEQLNYALEQIEKTLHKLCLKSSLATVHG